MEQFCPVFSGWARPYNNDSALSPLSKGSLSMVSKRFMLLSLAILVQTNQMLAANPGSRRRPQGLPVIRTEGGLHHMSLSPNHRLLAFTNAQGQSLRILDLTSQEVVEVTEHKTGPAFFWSPDGIRLFYRELIRDGQQVTSQLSAFDTKINQRAVLDSLAGSSGFPVLNPIDYTMSMMHERGILQKRLEFPGERKAQWQKQKKTNSGTWLASQSGALWLGELGLELKKMPDDHSGLSSFAISPDGTRITWATQAGKVYAAVDGGDVTYIGEGKDPSWHPYRTLLVYAASRKVGQRVYDYDLRFTNLTGQSRYLSQTQDLKERWPIWLDANTLLYTAENTTDLFKLDFHEIEPLARNTIPKGQP